MEEKATLGGGCFWCVEGCFRMLQGVTQAVSGFSGGVLQNPSYKEVRKGYSGHAEVVQLTFNPKVVSYEEIITHFFKIHDPTTLNRQGDDVGPMYRSAIFYHSDKQKEIAEKIKQNLDNSGEFSDKIVTQIQEFKKFWQAQDYHQDYFANNPQNRYCQLVVKKKMDKYEKYLIEQRMKKGQQQPKDLSRRCCRIL